MGNTSVQSILSQDRSGFEIIPLGSACRIAHSLRSKGMRNVALPFDWNVTPMQSTLELLANDFADFLDVRNLRYWPTTNRLLFNEEGSGSLAAKDVITPVTCRRYSILFPHDFSKAGAGDLEQVAEKYRRRIERLRGLLSSDLSLIFVAYDGKLNDWQLGFYGGDSELRWHNDCENWQVRLAELLDAKYPNLTYTTVELKPLLQLIDHRSMTLLQRVKNKAKRMFGT